MLRYGLEHSADVTARDIRAGAQGSQFTLVAPTGEARVVLGLPGRHNVSNALAAASLALAVGVDLALIAAVWPRRSRYRDARLPISCATARCWWTTATTPIPARWLRPSMPWPLPRKRAGWCWVTCASWADAEALHAQAGIRARAAGLKRLYALGPLSAAAATAFGDGVISPPTTRCRRR